MRKQLCLWLTGGAAVFLPALAHAEDEPKPYPECMKTPTDAETAAAKGAYQAGNASFDEADYPRAITYWEDAYRRDCTANLLLKNLARAYELYGQKRQAVVALETFLVREPNSGDKDQIQRRIEVLKKQIASEKTAPVAAVGTTPVAVTPATTASPPAAPPPEPAPSDHTGSRSAVPLFVAGGGAMLGIVGVVIAVSAAKAVKDDKAACPFDSTRNAYVCIVDGMSRPDLASKAQKDQHRETGGAVVAVIGGAALVGGLIWYLVEPRKAETTATTLFRPRVAASITPGFSGLTLSGAF